MKYRNRWMEDIRTRETEERSGAGINERVKEQRSRWADEGRTKEPKRSTGETENIQYVENVSRSEIIKFQPILAGFAFIVRSSATLLNMNAFQRCRERF